MSDQEQINLRVMSFNIRHGKGMDGKINLNRIAAEIAKSYADIVGLQEVDHHHPRSGFKDQAKILARELGMFWCFSPSLKLGFMQYGNAILSRYPIIQSRIHFLKGRLERRSALQATIELDGKSITVLNTHLGLTSHDQSRQLPKLHEIIASLQGAAIVLGDFNVDIDHLFMQRMIKKWNKISLPFRNSTVIHGKEIDHIFTNIPVNGLTKMKAWTQSTFASDHLPVVAQIGVESLAQPIRLNR